MSVALLELLPVLVELLMYGLGALLLSGTGVYLEEIAFTTAAAGQVALGGWMAVMGGVALYMGYLLLTDKCYSRAEELRAKLT